VELQTISGNINVRINSLKPRCIDGKPASDFYHYYLNNAVPDAIYPLAVFPPGETHFFLRGAVGYDSQLRSLTVSGDVPEQAVVQIPMPQLQMS
jgi:hypothetical protein